MKHQYKIGFNLAFQEKSKYPLLAYEGLSIVESRVDLEEHWFIMDTEQKFFSEIIGRDILRSEKAKHYKGDFTKQFKPSSLRCGRYYYTLVILGIMDSIREMLEGTYKLYLKKNEGKPEDKIDGIIDIIWETPVKKIEKNTHRMNLSVAVTLNGFTVYSNPDYRDLKEA